MADRPEDPPAETPIQRALRMRRAALASKPQRSDPAAGDRKRAAGIPPGATVEEGLKDALKRKGAPK